MNGLTNVVSFHYSTTPSLSVIKKVAKSIPSDKETVVACIGTDCSSGDSLGPIVGTLLQAEHFSNVIGTLNDPLDFGNYQTKFDEKYGERDNLFVIAVDAAFGYPTEVEQIIVRKGGLIPGSSLWEAKHEFGDLTVMGVINSLGPNNEQVLHTTSLRVVLNMALVISHLLLDVFRKLE